VAWDGDGDGDVLGDGYGSLKGVQPKSNKSDKKS